MGKSFRQHMKEWWLNSSHTVISSLNPGMLGIGYSFLESIYPVIRSDSNHDPIEINSEKEMNDS